jgi:hypothetical protein
VEPEKTPRERAEDLISLLVTDWRPTARQGLWVIRIVLAIVVVLGILTLVGQPFGITLWDWLKLLVVPAVIAGGGIWFNRQQRERELAIAERRTQEEALQAYLDQMSDLLTPNKDRPSLYDKDPPDSLRSVARARTLTVLPRLDGVRKGRVVQFLYESGLIARKRSVLDLQGADLSGADLSGAVLSGAFLRSAYLRGADLKGADLDGTDLSSADLGGAYLTSADLREANLSAATLRGALLGGADLSSADLRKADLSGADLSGADLSGADLSGADLNQARGWTAEQLRGASSLEGATMPYGRKYKDRPKDKEGRKADGENG